MQDPITEKYNLSRIDHMVDSKRIKDLFEEEFNFYTEELKLPIPIREKSDDVTDTFEDSSKYISNMFSGRDVVLNEKWDFSENIQAVITNVGDSKVFVDCLIDIERKIIKHRSFPIQLFGNLQGDLKGKPIIIKTQMKKGSSRIDVYSGVGMVDVNLFSSIKSWDEFEGKDLGSELKKW